MSAPRQGSVILQFVAALVGVLGSLSGCISGEVSAHVDGGSVSGALCEFAERVYWKRLSLMARALTTQVPINCAD